MKNNDDFILIKNSTENDWYYELNGRMIPFEKEDDNYYYMTVRGEPLRIPKKDASNLVKVELDLPDGVLDEIDKHAKEMGINKDEFLNKVLYNFIKNKGE